jgi:hypothetical protein
MPAFKSTGSLAAIPLTSQDFLKNPLARKGSAPLLCAPRDAGVAQLVEHFLAKEDVESSNLFARSPPLGSGLSSESPFFFGRNAPTPVAGMRGGESKAAPLRLSGPIVMQLDHLWRRGITIIKRLDCKWSVGVTNHFHL